MNSRRATNDKIENDQKREFATSCTYTHTHTLLIHLEKVNTRNAVRFCLTVIKLTNRVDASHTHSIYQSCVLESVSLSRKGRRKKCIRCFGKKRRELFEYRSFGVCFIGGRPLGRSDEVLCGILWIYSMMDFAFDRNLSLLCIVCMVSIGR